MGDGDELLPGAVGSVAAGGNAVERKLAFEDTDDFFMFAAAGHEVPDAAWRPGETGGYGAVLVVAVVGVEEIELVVFTRTMQDTLSIDDDAERHAPLLNGQGDLEASHSRGEALPMVACLDDRGEVESSPERHLDAISCIAGGQQENDGIEEKGPVHTEIQAISPLAGFLDLPEDISQEGEGGLAVVDITGAIFHPQNLTGLGEVGGDGIVAGNFAVMRIIAPEGSFNGQARGYDRSIDIDGESAKREHFDRPANDLGIECLETSDRYTLEMPEPAAESTQTRKPGQSAESLDEKISAKKVEVPQSPTADYQEPERNPYHGDDTEVTGQRDAPKVKANHIVETNRAQIANEKLESGVGTQAPFGKLDMKIVLDMSDQRGFSISHSMWPFVVGLKLADIPTFSHSERLFASMNQGINQYL